jgi:hypothetical protein
MPAENLIQTGIKHPVAIMELVYQLLMLYLSA